MPLPPRRTHSHDEAQINDHQREGNGGADEERRMDRDVVHEVGEEQVEREERRCQEEVVDRMQPMPRNVVIRRSTKKKKKRRPARSTDPAGQGPG